MQLYKPDTTPLIDIEVTDSYIMDWTAKRLEFLDAKFGYNT